MSEITVGLCESFKAIGIDILEADLRKFEKALYERGLNVAPRTNPRPEPNYPSGSGPRSSAGYGSGDGNWR